MLPWLVTAFLLTMSLGACSEGHSGGEEDPVTQPDPQPQPADQTPPSLSTYTPESTGPAPVSSTISATFSEPVNAQSVSSGFSVAWSSPASPVPSAVSGVVNVSGNTATFTPDGGPLVPGAQYSVTLSGVMDLAPTPNVMPVASWSFSTCGDVATASYLVEWDAVNDPALAGYRVYYGTTSPLTRANAMGTINATAGSTSAVLNGPAAGLQPCSTVHVAVTALSASAESAFSNQAFIDVE